MCLKLPTPFCWVKTGHDKNPRPTAVVAPLQWRSLGVHDPDGGNAKKPLWGWRWKGWTCINLSFYIHKSQMVRRVRHVRRIYGSQMRITSMNIRNFRVENTEPDELTPIPEKHRCFDWNQIHVSRVEPYFTYFTYLYFCFAFGSKKPGTLQPTWVQNRSLKETFIQQFFKSIKIIQIYGQNRINRAVSFQLLKVSEFPRSWSWRNPCYSHLFTHGTVSFLFLQGCFAGWNFSGCQTRRQVRSDEGAASSKPTRVFGELLDVWWENKLPKLHL